MRTISLPVSLTCLALLFAASDAKAQSDVANAPELITGPRCASVSTATGATMTFVDTDGVTGSDYVVRIFCSGEVRVGTFDEIDDLANGGGSLVGELPLCGGQLTSTIVPSGDGGTGTESFRIEYRPIGSHDPVAALIYERGRSFRFVVFQDIADGVEGGLDVR